MAVTKILKASKILFIGYLVLSLIVIGLFFFGGNVDPDKRIVKTIDVNEPVFLDVMMYWSYLSLFITIIAVIYFSIVGFGRKFSHGESKGAMTSIAYFLLLIIALAISYFMGSDSISNIAGYAGSDNTPFYNRLSEMFLYAIYFMLAITILSIIILPIIFSRRK